MKCRLVMLSVLLMAVWTVPSMAQEVGEQPPALHVTDWILGDPSDVGTWGDGTVYVLEFWGTWCSPCIENIPHLTQLQATYRERGLVVVGYSWEDRVTLEDFVQEMGDQMHYVVVGDTTERALQEFTLEGFPYTYLIDETGTIVWRGHPKALPEVVARFYEDQEVGRR